MQSNANIEHFNLMEFFALIKYNIPWRLKIILIVVYNSDIYYKVDLPSN